MELADLLDADQRLLLEGSLIANFDAWARRT
jgi:hypothetical protein